MRPIPIKGVFLIKDKMESPEEMMIEPDYEEADQIFYRRYRELARDIHFYLKDLLEGESLYALARDSEAFYELLRDTSSVYGDILVELAEREIAERIEAEEQEDVEEEYMHFA